MRIYLAAPWKDREDARGLRDVLQRAGHSVTSSWLDVDETKTTPAVEAAHDIADIKRADVVVVSNSRVSEGKSWEQGYAYCLGLPIIVINPGHNVFHNLPSMWRADGLTQALEMLDKGPIFLRAPRANADTAVL